MLLHNKLQKDYTLNQSGYQLKLPLELETIIPKNDSVRLLSQFVEEMDLTDLYSTYDRINSLSPRTLLKIVLYSYMNGDYSSRSMEFRNIKIKIFKTYIGLLKYANFWNIPFILINSNLSPVNKQLKATFIWFSFLSSSVQIKNQTVLVYTNLH